MERLKNSTGGNQLCSSASVFEKHTFGFFGLPRELRDKVYDETLTRNKRWRTLGHSLVKARNLPYEHLLLVNRQFRQELLERVLKFTYMVVEDQMHSVGKLPLPQHLQYVSNIEMHIGLPCGRREHMHRGCQVTQRLELLRKAMIEPLVALRNSRSISLNLYPNPHAYVSVCEDAILEHQIQLFKLTNDDRLKALNVYTCDAALHKNNQIMELRRGTTLIMEYSHQAKTLQRVGLKKEDEIDMERLRLS